jgi:maltooligosyltrehalose trehalohydrolase
MRRLARWLGIYMMETSFAELIARSSPAALAVGMHQQTAPVSFAHAQRTRKRSQGAELGEGGVHFRTWCKHERAEVIILKEAGERIRRVGLEPEPGGYFSGLDEAGLPGDLYQYRFGDSALWPDPASCYQPKGVHGPSMVVDGVSFPWTDESWVRPALSDLVIYELHIGTLTPQGTFRSAIERLPHLSALGVNAIEIMPIADFPGERNWGYDGVMLYAPARAYGSPDDFRAFIDAAHGHGLAVILDVVYNHFGPDGNYIGVYHDDYYAHPRRETPWGAALNYEAPPVRAFFCENPSYWMREFHVDGFRLDATHAIQDASPRHILAEIAELVHAEGGFLIAEDERNDAKLVLPPDSGGLGFDGVWADDFHHAVRVQLTAENEGYYANFRGTPNELVQTLTHGWLYRGQAQSSNGKRRGTDPTKIAPPQFIYCISNHDQAGNNAFGKRLNELTAPARYRAASALLCLVPQTPMLFMGQEWAAETPFQYFTDHTGELGAAISKGRRREFQSFAAFRDPALLETIPDPQATQTFAGSKLNWTEIEAPRHAMTLLLYSEFLRVRRTAPAFRTRERDSYFVLELANGIIAILFGRAGEFSLAVISDLAGRHSMPNLDDPRLVPGAGRDWCPLLSSNEERFGGDGSVTFAEAATMVFEAA